MQYLMSNHCQSLKKFTARSFEKKIPYLDNITGAGRTQKEHG